MDQLVADGGQHAVALPAVQVPSDVPLNQFLKTASLTELEQVKQEIAHASCTKKIQN